VVGAATECGCSCCYLYLVLIQTDCRHALVKVLACLNTAACLGEGPRFDMTSRRQEIVSEKNLTAKSSEVDFAIVLSRVITSIENDPTQLRNAVYELARVKLQTELSQREAPIDGSDKGDLASALESAIERVETVYSKHIDLRVLQSVNRRTNNSRIGASEITIKEWESALMIRAPGPDTVRLPDFLTGVTGSSRKVKDAWHWMGAAPLLRAAMVAIFAVVVCAVLDRQFNILGRQAPQPFASVVQKTEKSEAKRIVQASAGDLQLPIATPAPQSLGFPVPSVYGIYAISGGQLYELEPLVGRVPDQRVFMSTPIKTASRTVLPDGRALFIIYRRDAVNSAPERVSVRVIAKVLRAMTFNTAGQASTTNVQDTWTIRNISYDFRVAPLSEGSEMLMIRPENEDFVLPAGRYGLVIKGQAYDFTVAGPITEAAQCLEGIKAENGTFYSECRRPNEGQL
jgi:hypothetical protein